MATAPVNRIEAASVLVPAGTASASPQLTDVSFQDGVVQWIEVDVPSGHNRLTGLQILAAHGQMIPYTFGEFLIVSGRELHYDLQGLIDTGSFQANAYNTDIYDHTFYIRFGVLDFGYLPAAEPVAPLAPPPALV